MFFFLFLSQSLRAEDLSDHFSGLSLGAGLGVVRNNQNYKDDDYYEFHIPAHNRNYQTTDSVSRLDLSYAFKVNSNWLLAVGVNHDLTSVSSPLYELPPESGVFRARFKSKNHNALYLQPIYALDESTAVFAKLGYHRKKIEDTIGCMGCLTYTEMKPKGLGVGLGARYLFADYFYAQIEAEYVSFEDKSFNNNGYNWKYSDNETYGVTATLGLKF